MAAGNHSGTMTAYYTISKEHNKIKHKNPDTGEVVLYDYVEGTLVGIDIREDEYEGQPVTKICFTLIDSDGSKMVLQGGESSIFTRDAINGLASINGPISHVRFTSYISEFNGKNLTHCAVRHHGIKVKNQYKSQSSGGEIPDVKEAMVGRKNVKDDSERIEFFRQLIENVKPRLGSVSSAKLGLSTVADKPGDDDYGNDDLPF